MLHGIVLSIYLLGDTLLQSLQISVIIILQHSRGNLAYLCQHLVYECFCHSHRCFLIASHSCFRLCSRLINEVYGFIRQKAVADVFSTCLYGVAYNVVRVCHIMKFLIFLPQSVEDSDGLIYAWFEHVNLLETPYYALVFLEIAVVFLISCSTDKSYLAPFQIRLEHIRGIESVATATSADERMNLIYI